MALAIRTLIWIVGIHSIVHGIVGIFISGFSFYVNWQSAVINSYLAANILLLICGRECSIYLFNLINFIPGLDLIMCVLEKIKL